jgi:DNA-binding LytR/AlgR family response regulator
VYRLAVCDDNPADAARIISMIEKWNEKQGFLLQTESFPSAEAFLFAYEEKKDFDILFLDIEMGGISGVELAKKLRNKGAGMQLVFVTGYMDYIAEGYDVEALHYLLKPVTEEKFFAVLDRAFLRLRDREKTILLTTAQGTMRLPLHEIRYLEVVRNYVTVHAQEDYSVKRTLHDFEKELDERFCRTHRSYLVNLRFIKKITRSEVILKDGTEVPLARGQYDHVNQSLIAYF